jgi:hypothetical protein
MKPPKKISITSIFQACLLSIQTGLYFYIKEILTFWITKEVSHEQNMNNNMDYTSYSWQYSRLSYNAIAAFLENTVL